MADSRSLGSAAERQLLRKLPFRIEISEAIADPFPTSAFRLGNDLPDVLTSGNRSKGILYLSHSGQNLLSIGYKSR